MTKCHQVQNNHKSYKNVSVDFPFNLDVLLAKATAS